MAIEPWVLIIGYCILVLGLFGCGSLAVAIGPWLTYYFALWLVGRGSLAVAIGPRLTYSLAVWPWLFGRGSLAVIPWPWLLVLG